ncbi:MAG: TIGR02281 family clan AA aspartic protease [Rhodobacteraceae bacterium]|nr:TIGR02281 family clan AA aspartic protease [Paracoccaceae bacterium]
MEGYDIARLGYLIVLGLALTGWLYMENRRSRGAFLRQAAVWCFVFFGVIAAVGLWQDVRRELAPSQISFIDGSARIEAPRAFDGHYYLTVHINRVPVMFVVDTGATDVVLTREDAERLGVDTDVMRFSGRAGTANGEVRTARMRMEEIALGPVVDRNVPVLINSGEMQTSLLGMSYLQKFSRIEISDGMLVLER